MTLVLEMSDHMRLKQPHVELFVLHFTFYILFCKGLEMMGSDKICTASCTHEHVLSLCHPYPLPFT
jgi:hypothetical protein